jgi:exodeoxyribonuclease-3
MKIISWNTNGLRATVKQGNLLPLLNIHKPDILALQEVKVELGQLDESVTHIPGYEFYISSSRARKGYSGVSYYIKDTIKDKSLDFKIENGIGVKEFDAEGRNIIIYMGDYVFINTYFPNGSGGPVRLDYKLRFYDAYLKFVKKLSKNGKKVIFMGDVNTAHTEIDLARPKENVDNTGFLPIERAWIDEVIKADFVDTYRHLSPDARNEYTYWDQKTRARDRNVGWRIDYFFVSKNLLPQIKKSYMLTDYLGSDHCPLVLEFNI